MSQRNPVGQKPMVPLIYEKSGYAHCFPRHADDEDLHVITSDRSAKLIAAVGYKARDPDR
jgi:hypothetical protein